MLEYIIIVLLVQSVLGYGRTASVYRNITLSDNHIYEAYWCRQAPLLDCPQTVGHYRLDLNLCIANRLGQLEGADQGNFANSCNNCTLRKSEELHCSCSTGDESSPGFKDTWIVLPSVWTNEDYEDGAFGCFDHEAEMIA
ncbi:hypothetical protein GGR57DRAFT_501996 [Xylariaceae sp. FL1272]|nr:hypothetical protein GGR57DRAFT_501996 [Xylariaceae sp. FL1272]